MKKTFLMVFLISIFGILWAKDQELSVTQFEWGLEISNVNNKGKKVCEDNFIIKSFSNLEFTIYYKYLTKGEKYTKESLLEEINNSSLPRIKLNGYARREYSIDLPKDMKAYEKILIIPDDVVISGYRALCENDDLCFEIHQVGYNYFASEFNSANSEKIKQIKSDKKNYQSGDFLWTFTDNTYAKILAYVGKDEKVIIPTEIEELQVIAITGWYSLKAKEITIPASVKTIGEYAFRGCNLEKVNFELTSKLETVLPGAFSYNNLKQIYLPNKELVIYQNAFSNNPITQLLIKKEWEIKTERGGFVGDMGLYDLEYVEFESGQKYVHYQAFKDCKKLMKVVLPKTIELIQDQAFYNCSSLTEINVPSDAMLINPDNWFKDNHYKAQNQFYGCPLDFKTVKNLRALGFMDGAFEKSFYY